MINPSKLHEELQSAGIPIHGCSSDGRIDFKDEATDAQKKLAGEILAKHDPYDYQEERRKAYPPIGDQLDRIGKVFKYLRDNGTSIGPDGNEWLAEIESVKSMFPKADA